MNLWDYLPVYCPKCGDAPLQYKFSREPLGVNVRYKDAIYHPDYAYLKAVCNCGSLSILGTYVIGVMDKDQFIDLDTIVIVNEIMNKKYIEGARYGVSLEPRIKMVVETTEEREFIGMAYNEARGGK